MSDIEGRLRDLGDALRAEQSFSTLPPQAARRVKHRRLAAIGTSLVVAAALALGGGVAVGAFEPEPAIAPAEDTAETGPLIDYRRTGGFAGEDTRLSIDDEGRAFVRMVENGATLTTEYELRDGDLRGLEAAIEAVDWRARAKDVRFGPIMPADAIEVELRHDDYVVSGYHRGGLSREVTALVAYLDTLLSIIEQDAPLLVFPVQDMASGMESRFDGTLIRKGRCLLVRAPGSKRLVLPFWPPGSTYERRDGDIVVLSDGVVSARVGEPISLGGGIPGEARPASLRDEAGGCPGTFWITSFINP